MVRQNCFRILLIAFLSLTAAGLYSSSAEEKDKPGSRAINAKSRRYAARKAYEGGLQRRVQEPDAVPSGFGYEWSVRWLQAERDLSQTKAEHIAAEEAHLKRMQAFKNRVDNLRGQVAPYEVNAAEFFVLEAEDWLAAAKAESK